MKKFILLTIWLVSLTGVTYATGSTAEWTIDTGVSTWLNFEIPCVSVSNWTVNSQTCAITCNSWYTLSWNTCNIVSSWGGGWGWGWGGGWGWWSTSSTCTDKDLDCKIYLNNYIWQRKTWNTCDWWNLGKTCTVSSSWTTSTWSTWTNNGWTTWSTWNTWTGNGWTTWDTWNTWTDNGWTTWDTWLVFWWGSSTPKEGVDYTTITDETTWDVTITKKDGENVIIKDLQNTFAKPYIEKLVAAGIVNWYDDNTFKPDVTASRIEYLKIILKAANKDYSKVDTSKLTFKDVDKSTWMAKVLVKAIELKLINTQNENFNPDSEISRAEAMKMLILTLWAKLDINAVSSFDDVSWWAVKYVEKAKQLWIINWQEIDWKILFRPLDPIKRAEVAKIIIKTMELK